MTGLDITGQNLTGNYKIEPDSTRTNRTRQDMTGIDLTLQNITI